VTPPPNVDVKIHAAVPRLPGVSSRSGLAESARLTRERQDDRITVTAPRPAMGVYRPTSAPTFLSTTAPESTAHPSSPWAASRLGRRDHHSRYGSIVSIVPSGPCVSVVTLMLRRCVWPPDTSVSWERVVEAAFALRDRLQELGFGVFVKTSGGKGLHLVVPLLRRHSWEEVKDFSRAVAQTMVQDDPKSFTATMSKAKRKGKIFIDHFRNGRGATAVAAYSSRAKPEAPASAPVSLEERNSKLRPDQ